VVDIERFGTAIQLYGYDVTPQPTLRSTVQGTTTVTAGDVLRLTLYWRSLQRVSTSYSVFVHVLNPSAMLPKGTPPAGRGHAGTPTPFDGTATVSVVLAQRDSVPVNGARPTTTWVPGEFIPAHRRTGRVSD
jgi:hypothetical protein